MLNNKTTITIMQDEDNAFNISLKGNIEDILKGLAGATAQTIVGAPEHYQETLRSRFLSYLNQATIAYYKGFEDLNKGDK